MLTYNYIDIPRPYWTSTSTPEEIYADILEFASAFVSIDSRLTILEELGGLRGNRGGIVYIGFADEGIPIAAFCNNYENQSNSYRYLIFSLLNSNYAPTLSTGTGIAARYFVWDTSSTTYKDTLARVKYLTFKELLSFDFQAGKSTDMESNYAYFFITRIISPKDGTAFAHNCFEAYNGAIYCSASTSPGNVTNFAQMQYNNLTVGRYYMIECGLYNTMYILENVYFFSGTQTGQNMPQRFSFNGEEYQTLGRLQNSSYWPVCTKV